MSTRALAPRWSAVWTSPDPVDPSTRMEVGIIESTGDAPPTIYLSKYRGEGVASRSIGMGDEVAESVAHALQEAVARARIARR